MTASRPHLTPDWPKTLKLLEFFGGFLVSAHLVLFPNLPDVCVPDFFELIRQFIFGEILVGLAGDIEAGVELVVGRRVLHETHCVFLDDVRAPLGAGD